MTRALSTANLARASARRPWVTIGAWLAALVLALVVTGALLGDALTTDDDFTNTPDSKAAELLIEERLEPPDPVSDIVLVRSSGLTVDDPAFEQTVTSLASDLEQFGEVTTFYTSGDATLVSQDRDMTNINLLLRDDSEERADAFVEASQTLDGVGGFETAVTGVNIVDLDFTTVAEEDIQKGEAIGVLVALSFSSSCSAPSSPRSCRSSWRSLASRSRSA
jgi:RND superfamily putative drug exporter